MHILSQHQGLTKDPRDYPDKKNQPHVQVALRMREYVYQRLVYTAALVLTLCVTRHQARPGGECQRFGPVRDLRHGRQARYCGPRPTSRRREPRPRAENRYRYPHLRQLTSASFIESKPHSSP